MNRFTILAAYTLTLLFAYEGFAQSTWTYRRSGRAPTGFNTFAGTDSHFVAFGESGHYITSSDGKTWTKRKMESRSIQWMAIWAGSQFVILGQDTSTTATIMTSPDGITWSKFHPSQDTAIQSILWNGSYLAAIDRAGRFLTSSNGQSWSGTKILADTESFDQIFWTGKGFVITGFQYGENQYPFVMTSPDGKTWSRNRVDKLSDRASIIWNGKEFFSGILSSGDSTILTSNDGINWTSNKSNLYTPPNSVVWKDDKFVGITSTGVTISSDGINWTEYKLDNDAYFKTARIFSTGSLLVALSSNGSIRTSSDGVAWSTIWSLEPTPDLYGIASSPTQNIVVGKMGTILSSPDGITWTSRTSGTYQALLAVTWSGSQFIAVGDSGYVLTSADGLTWTREHSDVSNSLNGITWAGTQFIAVGSEGKILTSQDGKSWVLRNSGTTAGINALVWNGIRIVATTDSGTFLSSTDGFIWSKASAEYKYPLRSLVWSGSQFVAVGGKTNGGPLICTSKDGITWEQQGRINGPYGMKENRAITWTGSQFAIINSAKFTYHHSYIFTSESGAFWKSVTNAQNPTSLTLNSLKWTGSQFIAVGNNMTIVTSPQDIPTEIKPLASFNSSLLYQFSSSSLSLTLPSEFLGKKIHLRIFDSNGEKVLEKTVTKSNQQWNLPVPNLSYGSYLLEIKGTKNQITKSITVNR